MSLTQLAQDLASGSLRNDSSITPNSCDDAHDCGLTTADNWLKSDVDRLIKSSLLQKDGLLIIVFDKSGNDNTNGGGRMVCTLTGPAFSKLGYRSTRERIAPRAGWLGRHLASRRGIQSTGRVEVLHLRAVSVHWDSHH